MNLIFAFFKHEHVINKYSKTFTLFIFCQSTFSSSSDDYYSSRSHASMEMQVVAQIEPMSPHIEG